MSYYFNAVLKNTGFDEAIEKVTGELKKEGFGVLTEIDVKETFKKKLDVDFRKYKILGACNPNFAYKALQNEGKTGVFLPCNVVVEENSKGEIEISAVDPVAALSSSDNNAVKNLSKEVQQALERVIKNLG